MRTPIFVTLMAVVALALISCDGPRGLAACPGPNAPDSASCRWETTQNSLIMRVEGHSDSAVKVHVNYQNAAAGDFSTAPVDVVDGQYAVFVPRLRSDTEYNFSVVETDATGLSRETHGGALKSGPLPEALRLANIQVTKKRDLTQDLVFMDFNMDNEPGSDDTIPAAVEGTPTPTPEPQPSFYGLIAIDNDGQIVWYAQTDYSMAMAQESNDNIALIEEKKGLKEIDPLGDVLNTAPSPCSPDGLWHHEMSVMPDGRLMTLGYETNDVFNDPARIQSSETITIWDPGNGDPQAVWHVFDHLDATTTRTTDSDKTEGFMWRGCDADLQTQDWTHSNSAKVTPDGNWIFSMRHLDQVLKIDPNSGDILWRLGGPDSDFTFPDSADKFYHQHAAWELPNGHILVFDNGNTRPDEDGGEYSRGLELELDFNTMTARKVWEYKPDPELYAQAVGNVVRLDNGDTYVHFGTDPHKILTMDEVDSDGNPIWEAKVSAPGLTYIYRSYPETSVWGEHKID